MSSLLIGVGLVGLFLGWNVPNHYPPWTAFHNELAAALGLCAIFCGVALTRGSSTEPRPAVRVALPLPPAARAWAAISLIPLLQYVTGGLHFHGDAALGLAYGLGTALAIYAGHLWAAHVGTAGVTRLVWLTLVWGGLLAAALALRQWLGIPAGGWWAMELIESRPYGNLAQPNHFGLLMAMGVVAATALYEVRTLEHRFSYYLVLTVFGWGIVASGSRAALLAVVVVAVLWLVSRNKLPTRLRLPEVLLLLAGLALLHLGLGTIEQALYIAGPPARQILDVGPREAIWRHFLAAALQRPWFGYGFGQGVMALAEVAAQGQPSRNTIYAHNVVLDLMVWVGIPLAVALSVALTRWLMSWFASAQAESRWVLAIWVALLVQSLLEFPYAHSFFLLPAALLAGAVTPAAATPNGGHRVSAGALLLATVAALLLAAITSDYLRLEDEFRLNRFRRANFFTQPADEPPTQPYVLDQLAALNATARFDIRAGMPSEQIQHLAVVARRFHILPIRMDYARALALNGRRADAEHELRVIRGIYAPAIYERIEDEWLRWLRENGLQTLSH